MAGLLRTVDIERFRSFRRASLAELDAYVPIVGLNSSGKSNVLRALNLFFNGVLDEQRTPPSLDLDYPDFALGDRQKKRIAVAVEFDLSDGYEVRNTADLLSSFGIKDSLWLEREWSLAPNKVDTVESLRIGPSKAALADVSEQDRAAALTFVQSVEFRYVPNHLRPADVIQREIQALRRKLINRFQRTKAFREGNVDESMIKLVDVAQSMFAPVSEGVSAGTSGRAIVPDIPTTFADLAFQVGLNTLTESGSVQPTELQGSGTQSFILLHVLQLLDSTMRDQGFGWKQYSVWGVEEPESFLHAGLRSRYAEDMHRAAADPRRQVFATTHQDEFVRVADHAWITSMHRGESTVDRLPTRDAIEQSARQRISAFVHPLMAQPDHPVVLVEGRYDALYLRRAAQASDRRPRWRLVSLEDADMTQGGGDNVKPYLAANRAVVASRSLGAPLFVLRDWEDENKVESYRKILEVHESSTAWCCPVDLVNPQLGRSFRGIERYLPTDFVETALGEAALKPHSLRDRYPLGVDQATYKKQLKQQLASRFEDDDSVEPGEHLVRLFEWLDDEITRVFGELPPSLFT